MEHASSLEFAKEFDEDHEKLKKQSERIASTLRIFADKDLMSDHALNAAQFQAMVDTLRDKSSPIELRHNLAVSIPNYLGEPASPIDARGIDYVMAIWSDMPAIDETAGAYQARLASHGGDVSSVALRKLDGAVPMTVADWHNIRVGVDIPALASLIKDVNVESTLARSALLLDRVATATTYDNELLQDILEIETVHAPLQYLLGLPGWEAILKHHTEKARIMATGDEEKIGIYNEASEYIEQVRASGLGDKVLQDILGVPNIDEDQFSFIVNNVETPYGSKGYFGAIRCGDEPDERQRKRIISRIKSPGSYAHKVLHNESYKHEKPQDVFAATVITSTIEKMTDAFAETYARIVASPSCEFVVAASKDSPIHLRGKNSYRETVKAGLGADFKGTQFDEKDIPEDAHEPFQVLKVTFVMRGKDGVEMPVEVQFQTREDRNASRLGGASHLCVKDSGINGLPGYIRGESSDQKDVNDAKWRMLEKGRTADGNEDIIVSAHPERLRSLQSDILEAFDDAYEAKVE